MSKQPRFKVERTTIPGEYMGEVFLGEERVMKRLLRARDNMKALSQLQGMYQSIQMQKSPSDQSPKE